jgi:DNA mismatch endonuclease (patch repair protein)
MEWVKTAFSTGLSGRRSRDTSPELELRRSLFRLGFRYRVHQKIVNRATADIVFAAARVAVFVDGCFWHGCPAHGKLSFRGPNEQLWTRKIQATRCRDQQVAQKATEQGWRVVRVWECEVRRSPAEVASQISRLLRQN